MAVAASRNHQKRKERMVNERRKQPNRLMRFFIGFGLVLFAGVVISVFYCSSRIPRGRLGLVIQGDPTVFVSWETDRSRFAVFILPSSMQVEAIHGYGWYRLDALWKLDTMDRHGGIVYTNSLQEALATPVRWYIEGTAFPDKWDADTAVSYVKQQVSLTNLIHAISSRKTNISVFDLWYLLGQMQRVGTDSLTYFDFRQGQITSESTLPDGTTATRFDATNYDAVVGNTLEDTPFRQEGMRIAIYNTTGTPGIGQRIARMLERLGGFVVFVGNDDIPVNGMCDVSADKQVLSSLTVSFLHSFYGCRMVETHEDHRRADIVVHIGTELEKRYRPQ